MTQIEFSLEAGREARDSGMKAAAKNNAAALSVARQAARNIAMQCGCVDINAVQKIVAMRGLKLGNAAGSVFKGKEWERVGFGQADRVSSHVRELF